MMQSGEEDDKEVADVLQNQIYYNGDLLDTALQFFTILRPDNKNQPLTLQDSTVHFAYVLLRMLEKYSKSKSYMYVRKRKGARKKQGAVPVNDIDDENEEMLDTQKGEPSYSEHAFTFTTFERVRTTRREHKTNFQRFAQETVAKSLLTYLARYHALDGERLKRVVNLIHRQVVKGKAEGLFFTIPALHLFKSIMDEKDSLPPGDASKDLVKLITYILRSFFKMVEKDPWTLVEATLPKGRAGWRHLSSIDDEDDDGMGGQRSRIQEKLAQQQLEFTKKSNLSWSQQMGVVISILVKEGRQEWIKEVIGVLEIALAGRQEVVLRVDADRPAQIDEDEDDENVVRDFRGPSKEAIEQFEKFGKCSCASSSADSLQTSLPAPTAYSLQSRATHTSS